MCTPLSTHLNCMMWYCVKSQDKSEWHHDLWFFMRSIRVLLLLSCAKIVMDISWCMILTYISWMIWMTSGGNKLVSVIFCCIFSVPRSVSDKIPSLSFPTYGFLLGVLGFFQPITGVFFYPEKFVLFLCCNIICVCCDVSGGSVEIVTVFFVW